MKTVLVTGTDTGVGKTWVTALLIRQLRLRGWRTGAYKPVCSGADRSAPGEAIWTDVETLRAACDHSPPIDLICPQRFHAPVAPNVAAHCEGRAVDDERLFNGVRDWEPLVDWLVIEGAGGIYSPLSNCSTTMDLATVLSPMVIIVAANRLGVINHTRLTVEALRYRKAAIAAIVLNNISEPSPLPQDYSTDSNAAQLLQWIPGIPLFQCQWRSDVLLSLTNASDLVELLER